MAFNLLKQIGYLIHIFSTTKAAIQIDIELWVKVRWIREIQKKVLRYFHDEREKVKKKSQKGYFLSVFYEHILIFCFFNIENSNSKQDLYWNKLDIKV